MKHGRRINTMNIPDDVDINYDSEPDDVEQKLSNKKYISFTLLTYKWKTYSHMRSRCSETTVPLHKRIKS